MFSASLVDIPHMKKIDSEAKPVLGKAHNGTLALVAKRRLSYQGGLEEIGSLSFHILLFYELLKLQLIYH